MKPPPPLSNSALTLFRALNIKMSFVSSPIHHLPLPSLFSTILSAMRERDLSICRSAYSISPRPALESCDHNPLSHCCRLVALHVYYAIIDLTDFSTVDFLTPVHSPSSSLLSPSSHPCPHSSTPTIMLPAFAQRHTWFFYFYYMCTNDLCRKDRDKAGYSSATPPPSPAPFISPPFPLTPSSTHTTLCPPPPHHHTWFFGFPCMRAHYWERIIGRQGSPRSSGRVPPVVGDGCGGTSSSTFTPGYFVSYNDDPLSYGHQSVALHVYFAFIDTAKVLIAEFFTTDHPPSSSLLPLFLPYPHSLTHIDLCPPPHHHHTWFFYFAYMCMNDFGRKDCRSLPLRCNRVPLVVVDPHHVRGGGVSSSSTPITMLPASATHHTWFFVFSCMCTNDFSRIDELSSGVVATRTSPTAVVPCHRNGPASYAAPSTANDRVHRNQPLWTFTRIKW
jgi:hypothetical protein